MMPLYSHHGTSHLTQCWDKTLTYRVDDPKMERQNHPLHTIAYQTRRCHLRSTSATILRRTAPFPSFKVLISAPTTPSCCNLTFSASWLTISVTSSMETTHTITVLRRLRSQLLQSTTAQTIYLSCPCRMVAALCMAFYMPQALPTGPTSEA